MLATAGDLAAEAVGLQASGDVRLSSASELGLKAGSITAGGSVNLSAANDLSLQPTPSYSSVIGNGTRSDLTRFTRTDIDAGGAVAIQSSAGLVTLDGTQIKSGASIAVQGLGVALLARKDLTKTTTTGATTTAPTTENLVQARLIAEGDIALLATGGRDSAGVEQGKLFITGAKIEANNGHVSLLAAKDLDIAHDITTDTSYERFYEVKRGWFSKRVTDITKTSTEETANPSDISGRSVSIGAGGNLNIVGSLVMADGAVGLHADQDLNLLATSESSLAYESRSVTKSGIFGNGGLSITIGSKNSSNITSTQETRQASTSVGSLAGDVLATAGGQYLQLSSDITAPQGDIHIAAQNITLQSNNNTRSVLNIVRERQSGITLSASNPLVSGAQTATEMAKVAKRTENGRYQAMALLTSGLTIYNQYHALTENSRALTAATQDAAVNQWTFSASLGSSQSNYESLTSSTTPVESSINAGRNVSLTATGGVDRGDINLVGSRITASQNLTLRADRDITMTAAVGRDTEQTKRSSSAASVGISFGVGGPQAGVAVTLAASRSNAWSNGWGSTFWNSELTAGKLLSVDAGRDWSLSGAKATGETVLARVGSKGAGNLSVLSPQDESFYQAKEQSYGFNASIPWPGNPYGTPSLGVNASGLKLLAENESVKQQSSIVAGSGGYDVRVNGHTHLKASAIASKAEGWRNYFETQTLTHEDVLNRDVASGTGWSVAVNISAGSSGAGALAGSSVGFARMDTNETFTTRSSVASTVNLTRPDLQAGRVAAMKAAERDPLTATRDQKQRDLNVLRWNEPPPCDGCAYNAVPTTPDAVAKGAQAAAVAVAVPAAGSAGTDSNSQWRAWQAAMLRLQREIDALNIRIGAVDAKLYQASASLSNSPSGLHQPLLHTFDKAKATQELRDGVAVTAAFGKAAYRAAGDYAGDKFNAAVKACAGSTNCPDAEKWKDGGAYRAALHLAIGGMSFGAPGALGAGAGQAVLNVMDNAFFAKLGITDPTAINLLKSAAVTMAGATAGSTGGAAAAFNADANNRQLHPKEIEIIRREAHKFAKQQNGGAEPTTTEVDAAEKRLAQEAFRLVQFGTAGNTDNPAKSFLRTFNVQLPGDPSISGQTAGFSFYADPVQKANPNMYANLIAGSVDALDFYGKNQIVRPTLAQASAAIARFQRGQDKSETLTKLAGLFAGGLTLAPLAPAAITACLSNITICAIQTAELAAGSTLGPTGMGIGMLASRAGFKNAMSAEQANAELIAARPGNTAAWNPGTAVFQADMVAGTKLRMYVDQTQFERLSKGDLSGGLGGWGTFDAPVQSVFQMRSSVALTEAFKPTSKGPFYVVELEVTKPMPSNVGFAGQQLGNGTGNGTHAAEPSKYIGGGTQIQLPSWDVRAQYLRITSPPKCVGGGC